MQRLLRVRLNTKLLEELLYLLHAHSTLSAI